MISIKISFVLGFSSSPPTEKTPRKKRGKRKKIKKQKKKYSKKSKSATKRHENIEVKVEKPKHVIEIGSPLCYAHIEYELLPGTPKYLVDVVCYGTVVKVISIVLKN